MINALGGFVKPIIIMELQTTINAILSLSSVIDALNRAGQKKAIDEIVPKLLELVNKL